LMVSRGYVRAVPTVTAPAAAKTWLANTGFFNSSSILDLADTYKTRKELLNNMGSKHMTEDDYMWMWIIIDEM